MVGILIYQDEGIVQTTNSESKTEAVKTEVVSITQRSVVQIHPPQVVHIASNKLKLPSIKPF